MAKVSTPAQTWNWAKGVTLKTTKSHVALKGKSYGNWANGHIRANVLRMGHAPFRNDGRIRTTPRTPLPDYTLMSHNFELGKGLKCFARPESCPGKNFNDLQNMVYFPSWFQRDYWTDFLIFRGGNKQMEAKAVIGRTTTGSPSSSRLSFFGWEGSPAKVDLLRKETVPTCSITSLLEEIYWLIWTFRFKGTPQSKSLWFPLEKPPSKG